MVLLSGAVVKGVLGKVSVDTRWCTSSSWRDWASKINPLCEDDLILSRQTKCEVSPGVCRKHCKHRLHLYHWLAASIPTPLFHHISCQLNWIFLSWPTGSGCSFLHRIKSVTLFPSPASGGGECPFLKTFREEAKKKEAKQERSRRVSQY